MSVKVSGCEGDEVTDDQTEATSGHPKMTKGRMRTRTRTISKTRTMHMQIHKKKKMKRRMSRSE